MGPRGQRQAGGPDDSAGVVDVEPARAGQGANRIANRILAETCESS